MGWFPQQAGGLNRMYFNLVRHLPETGTEVRGLVAGQPIPQNGVSINAFAAPEDRLLTRLLRARSAARQALATYNPDVVASHFALYTVSWLDLIGDRPLVVHFHGPWAAESNVEATSSIANRLKKHIERLVYQRADRFIVLSSAFRDVLVNDYGISPTRIHIVPGGVDVQSFSPDLTSLDARLQLGWPTERPIIFAVRRLARRMGLETLIEAIDRIRRTIPNVLLMIAGKGPLASELVQKSTEMGLEDHVQLLGFVPDELLPSAYRAATLSIVPTVALEGFGLITIESLAAGTPVLVTPVGGLPEVVAPLSSQLVLEGTGPDAIADGIRRALTTPARLPSPERCTAYAQEHFDWPLIVPQIRTVYDHALRS